MLWAVRIGILGLALYLACLVALLLGQRRLMYFPATFGGDAADAGLADAQTLSLATSDGERIVAWYKPAAPGRPLFLFFHGNGDALSRRAAFLVALSADGSGFLAIDYRGYGGSTGSPSESGLLRDGNVAYAKVRDFGYAPDRIVILGQSIGTGVAVAIAAAHPAKALVLDSAFSATVDVAAARYWMFPVRLLMKDTYTSRERIGSICYPKLFLHGTDDPIIPIAFDRALFARAAEPKTFISVPGRGHVVLLAPDVLAQMKDWLAGLPAS